MIFYSPSTGGFYARQIHGEQIPDDAIQISAEQHEALLSGANSGKRIVVQAGVPSLVKALPPSPERLAEFARRRRNALLLESDWTALPDTPLDTFQRDAWMAYRQALRGVSAQPEFPAHIDWPERPAA